MKSRKKFEEEVRQLAQNKLTMRTEDEKGNTLHVADRIVNHANEFLESDATIAEATAICVACWARTFAEAVNDGKWDNMFWKDGTVVGPAEQLGLTSRDPVIIETMGSQTRFINTEEFVQNVLAKLEYPPIATDKEVAEIEDKEMVMILKGQRGEMMDSELPQFLPSKKLEQRMGRLTRKYQENTADKDRAKREMDGLGKTRDDSHRQHG